MTLATAGPAVIAAVIAGAYLLGSFPTGYLIARRRGVDIRARGSGNIGATNVTRSLGKKLGLVVLLADVLKGAASIWLVRALGAEESLGPLVITAVGVAAVVGHCFPVWLRFRGGKGVATTFGVIVMVDPVSAGLVAVMFVGVYLMFRVASAGSLAAAIALPVWMLLGERPWEITLLGLLCAAVVVLQHRDNIRRLLRREEHRL